MPQLIFRFMVASLTFGAGLLTWALWVRDIYRRLPWEELMSLLLYSLASFWCFVLAASGKKTKGKGDRIFTLLMLACGGLFLWGVLTTVREEVIRILNRMIMAHNGIVEIY